MNPPKPTVASQPSLRAQKTPQPQPSTSAKTSSSQLPNMEVPENALSIPTVAYTTLKTLLNKCVTSQYRLGKDNTKLALELLACMEGHISNPASTEDALPVMDSLPQRASSLTKSITLSDLQETL